MFELYASSAFKNAKRFSVTRICKRQRKAADDLVREIERKFKDK